MHMSGSPLLRETKIESCSSPTDDNSVINSNNAGGFSVIFRPSDPSINSGLSTNASITEDGISSHRYPSHASSRLVGIHSRPEDGNHNILFENFIYLNGSKQKKTK